MNSIAPSVQSRHTGAAHALVALLPSPVPLTIASAPNPGSWAGQVREAVVASFVGDSSADVAVVLSSANAVATEAGIDSTLVSVVDVLRPALEGATSIFGAGVLGEARVDDASALFDDEETMVFEIAGTNGVTAGWFAIRVRETALLGSSIKPAIESVVDKLGRINSVEMTLTVEIGRTRMSVRDVLSLEPGAVIELDRSAGAPADVLLNGRLIAHGEIVVVDQDYAVRITRILDVAESVA